MAFGGSATTLVTGDTNAVRDVFVRYRQLGLTERVSIDSTGAQGNALSDPPTVSGAVSAT